MKITNKTHWQTDQLRSLIYRIGKDELDGHWSAKFKTLRVLITYTRPGGGSNQTYSSGCATVGGTWMNIRIAKNNPDKVDVAHVIAHEMAHLRGMQHSQMTDDPKYRRVGDWRERYAWANDVPLDVKVVKKAANNVVEIRSQRVLVLLSKWETKLKSAQKKVRQYQQKAKYYEKKKAACNTLR